MALSASTAEVLVSTTCSLPHWQAITPRWLLRLLPWTEVATGVYLVNRVIAGAETKSEHPEGTPLRVTFPDYDPKPQEIRLSQIDAVLEMHVRLPHLLNYPHDQLAEQIRLVKEAIKEEQERLLLNSTSFGLLHACAPDQRLQAKGSAPTPDDMDELLSMVWNSPGFFVAHPKAIAEFGRQCTSRGVPLESVVMFGVPFVTWRGVPLVPSTKMPLGAGKKGQRASSIVLLRTGEERQGVSALRRGQGVPHGIVIRDMGVDSRSIATYLLTCFFSLSIPVDDAVAVLEGVRV